MRWLLCNWGTASIVDNCLERLSLKRSLGIHFVQNGRKTVSVQHYTLRCYKWRLQIVFNCFMLFISLKSSIKISILGYRACGMYFSWGWRRMVGFVVWLVLGFWFGVCFLFHLSVGDFSWQLSISGLKYLFNMTWTNELIFFVVVFLLQTERALVSITTWSIFPHSNFTPCNVLWLWLLWTI